MSLMRAPALLALVLAIACGDDAPDAGSGGERAEACSVSITGAVSGTPTCRATSLIHRADGDATTFTLETQAGESLTVLVASKLPGPPSATDYGGPSGTFTCGVSVRQGARAWFTEYSSPGTLDSISGNCGLSFSRVEVSESAGGTTTYRDTGSLIATLHALTRTGASGTVEVRGTFTY